MQILFKRENSLKILFLMLISLLAVGVSEEEKQIILQKHNWLRQAVAAGRFPGQPYAENMREMVWDNELAEHAQKWAENCQFRHDPHRTIGRFIMGQNLAIIWSTAPLEPDDGDFASRIQNWFNEVQKYSFGDPWSPKTGHYSQLVWADTYLIGCGYAEYRDASKYNKLYVCNYGPGGNVVGYKPYKVGKPSCNVHGMKVSPRYKGLCITTDSDIYNENSIDNSFKNLRPYHPTNPNNFYQHTAPNAFGFQTFATNSFKFNNHPAAVIKDNGPNDGWPPPPPPNRQQTDTIKTLQFNHDDQYNKLRQTLETLKASSLDFPRTVLQNTILRTLGTTEPKPWPAAEQWPQQPTEKPHKTGWNLFNWRG